MRWEGGERWPGFYFWYSLDAQRTSRTTTTRSTSDAGPPCGTPQTHFRHQRKNMKVIIAGSRTIRDMNAVETAIRLSGYHITEVVSGGAGGVDSLGEEWALQNGIPCRGFSVEDFQWAKSRGAGHKRNLRMGRYADALVAVWDGRSPGTKDMIEIMKSLGKPYYLYLYSRSNT